MLGATPFIEAVGGHPKLVDRYLQGVTIGY
jgi:hypothetical protein